MVQVISLSSASLAKVCGLMYLILAVIVSPFIILMAISEDGTFDPAAATFAIIFVVLFYGIAGVIGGFLTGITYNFIAKKFGGIEMEIETA